MGSKSSRDGTSCEASLRDLDHVRRELGQRASLSVESRVSGPVRGVEDPFSREEADIGFMCAPSFFWLRALEDSPVELLPAAPVFQYARTRGRPVSFSEVIVHRCRSLPRTASGARRREIGKTTRLSGRSKTDRSYPMSHNLQSRETLGALLRPLNSSWVEDL